MMLASLLTSDVGSAFLRAIVVAFLAIPIAGWLDQWLSRLTGTRRTCGLVVVLLPVLAPELLVGYGFASFELSLLHRPSWNQCLYLVLLVLKFAPAGLLARTVMPEPEVSAEAEFCAKLMHRQGSILTLTLTPGGWWLSAVSSLLVRLGARCTRPPATRQQVQKLCLKKHWMRSSRGDASPSKAFRSPFIPTSPTS